LTDKSIKTILVLMM